MSRLEEISKGIGDDAKDLSPLSLQQADSCSPHSKAHSRSAIFSRHVSIVQESASEKKSVNDGKHTVAAWNSLVALQIRVLAVANQTRRSRFAARCHSSY